MASRVALAQHACDKHRLLAIVETAFGDYHVFNRMVHDNFADRVSRTHAGKSQTLLDKIFRGSFSLPSAKHLAVGSSSAQR